MKLFYSLITRTDHLFLKSGVFFYFLNKSGNIAVVIISSLLNIPSCPELFLFSRLSIAFNVSVSVVHLN